VKNEKELLIPSKVPQSKEFTVNKMNYYKNKEYMDFYTENEIKIIRNHDLYLKLYYELVEHNETEPEPETIEIITYLSENF
jgi:hypothetical protein